MASQYFANPTTVVDEGCRIGEGTKIWHFSHSMSDCFLGEKCNFRQNVVISLRNTIKPRDEY